MDFHTSLIHRESGRCALPFMQVVYAVDSQVHVRTGSEMTRRKLGRPATSDTVSGRQVLGMFSFIVVLGESQRHIKCVVSACAFLSHRSVTSDFA